MINMFDYDLLFTNMIIVFLITIKPSVFPFGFYRIYKTISLVNGHPPARRGDQHSTADTT